MSKFPKSRESVKVAIRCRPMSAKEKKDGYEHIVRVDQPNASIYVKNPQGQEVQYTYDFTFPESCTQEDIYEMTAAPIVSGVLEGINGTIFAYGQTGTGKTYTMDNVPEGPDRGIVPRAFEHIFDYITAHQDSHRFSVTVTYIELYNEKIRDLLTRKKDVKEEKNLSIHEDPEKGFVVRGVTAQTAKSVKELLQIQKMGSKHRTVRATAMNEDSSRSHSILTLNIETLTQIDGSEHVRVARLNLVDLAGSEKISKTQTDREGEIEGASINYALMILGNCISALTTKGQTHIPYRDSNLTKLLRDSLGGTARTLMIAAVGPASYNFYETMSTLRYAERAKKIENKPKVNMDPKDALLLKYQEEARLLQEQLNGGAESPQSSEEAIRAMEEKLELQKKKLAEATNLAKEKREELEKKLAKKQKKIELEREKQKEYQQRLDELSKYLIGGGQELVKRTQQNEAEIAACREKLKQRELRSKMIEKELIEKRTQKKVMVSQCKDLKDKVKVVSAEFKELSSQYKNLKLKFTETQKAIQEDREQITNQSESLRQQIEIYNYIIDNFIPKSEVQRANNTIKYDDEQERWVRTPIDKATVLDNIKKVGRPKSAIGYARPTASSGINRTEEFPKVVLKPAKIESRLKDGPPIIQMDGIEEEIEKQFIDDETNLQVEIPESLQSLNMDPW